MKIKLEDWVKVKGGGVGDIGMVDAIKDGKVVVSFTFGEVREISLDQLRAITRTECGECGAPMDDEPDGGPFPDELVCDKCVKVTP